jgi:hypothetical protein
VRYDLRVVVYGRIDRSRVSPGGNAAELRWKRDSILVFIRST